ncbi:MAG: ABC transporter permease subunit [Planctomycetaceae bacterium]|nr:ABC transporter permease subunit [Planctomycetaceae bacterium]
MLRWMNALVGPIFAKEMVEIARRKRYYFNRFLYSAALLVAVTIAWQDSAWGIRQGRGQLQAMARVAQEIFIVASVVQLGAIYLLVPMFVSGLIAGEREANSLELLFTTSLVDREIILGKLASRLVTMGLLVVCGIPIVNLVLLLGGVDPWAVVRTETVTLLAILEAGTVTMYFSTISRTPTAALVRSLWWMGVGLLGLPIAGAIFVGIFNIRPGDPWAIVLWGQAFLNPLFLFVVGLDNNLYGIIAGYLGAWFYPLAFAPTLLLCAFLLWRSMARLRLPPTLLLRLSSRWHPLATLLDSLGRWRQRREELRRLNAERFCRRIPVQNPFWWRACCTPVYDRDRHIARIQYLGWLGTGAFLLVLPWAFPGWPPNEVVELWLYLGGFAVTLSVLLLLWKRRAPWAWRGLLGLGIATVVMPMIVFEPRAWRDDDLASVFLVPIWTAMFLLAGILASTSLVGDRRRGFLELVLISPLEPREILRGTWLAVAQHLTPVAVLVVAVTAWFWWFGAISAFAALATLLTGFLFTAVVLQVGIVCSLAAERTPAAVIPTVVLGATFCVGLLLLGETLSDLAVPVLLFVAYPGLAICRSWARRRATPAAFASLYGCFLLALLLLVLHANARESWWFLRPRNAEEMLQATSTLGLIAALLQDYGGNRLQHPNLYVLCYWLVLAATLIVGRLWAIRNFDRLAGRAHQEHRPAVAARPIVQLAPMAEN